MLTIQGVPVSAHTRKVIVAALHKGLEFTLDPVVPLQPPPGWAERSPLGTIPVLLDGHLVLNDSSVILAYLERKVPQRPLFPSDLQDYARALWLEEYVDGGLAGPVLRDFLRETKLNPMFMNQPTNHTLVARTVEEVMPPRLAYLESQVDGPFLVGDAFSVADLTVASMLTNYQYGGGQLGAFPRLLGWLSATQRREPFVTALRREAAVAAKLGFETGFLDGVLS
jgi:glutathione S-transferase